MWTLNPREQVTQKHAAQPIIPRFIRSRDVPEITRWPDPFDRNVYPKRLFIYPKKNAWKLNGYAKQTEWTRLKKAWPNPLHRAVSLSSQPQIDSDPLILDHRRWAWRQQQRRDWLGCRTGEDSHEHHPMGGRCGCVQEDLQEFESYSGGPAGVWIDVWATSDSTSREQKNLKRMCITYNNNIGDNATQNFLISTRKKQIHNY